MDSHKPAIPARPAPAAAPGASPTQRRSAPTFPADRQTVPNTMSPSHNKGIGKAFLQHNKRTARDHTSIAESRQREWSVRENSA